VLFQVDAGGTIIGTWIEADGATRSLDRIRRIAQSLSNGDRNRK